LRLRGEVSPETLRQVIELLGFAHATVIGISVLPAVDWQKRHRLGRFENAQACNGVGPAGGVLLPRGKD
jgi:hypothetical protein